MDRYNHSLNILISAKDDDTAICLAPRTGDMQGDISAPQKLAQVYDGLQEQMMTESRTFREEQELTFVEPITQTSHLADHLRYADDLVTVGLASTIPQINGRVKDWDEGWDRSCLPAGLVQNADETFLDSFHWAEVS
eukprot:10829508-Heterocapsa_arctica.AAC.1